MKTTLFLISTLLLALSPPTLSNHNSGGNSRFGRQDQPDLESLVVDEDDELSVLDMAQDMLQLGVRPVLGYVLNALIVVSMFLLAANILQLTLFPLVSAGVQSAGRAMRDNIAAGFNGFPGFGFFADMMREEAEKAGRSLWGEEVASLANAVSKAVEVYTNLNEEHEWSEQEEHN